MRAEVEMQPSQPTQPGYGPPPGQGFGPPGGAPQGWGQPVGAPPPPPPPRKSNSWVLAIVGCAVLVVIGVPCLVLALGGFGGLFFARRASESAQSRSEAYAEASRARREAEAARARNEAEERAAVNAAAVDPRDAPFAAFVADASRAIESTARGQPHDTRWDSATPQDDLRRTGPEVSTALAPLGSWRVAATSLEVEAISPAPGGTAYVRSSVLVLPDGRVRWLSVEARVQPTVFLRPSIGIAQAAPALAAFAERMVAALGSPGCALPIAAPSDLTGLPRTLERENRAARTLFDACAVVRNVGPAAAWQPRYDDLSLFVTGNGQWASLRSGFEMVRGQQLILNTVRARVLPSY